MLYIPPLGGHARLDEREYGDAWPGGDLLPVEPVPHGGVEKGRVWSVILVCGQAEGRSRGRSRLSSSRNTALLNGGKYDPWREEERKIGNSGGRIVRAWSE